MAKGRVFKKKIVDSRRWRALYNSQPLHPHAIYPILVVATDPWGMVPADGFRLKSLLGPHDPYHGPDAYEEAIRKLHDIGLVHVWVHQDLPWLYVIGHDQEQSQAIHSRKSDPEVPRPPAEEMDKLAEERSSKYTNNGIKVYNQSYTSRTQVVHKSKINRTQVEDESYTSRDSRDFKRDLKRGKGNTTQALNDPLLPPIQKSKVAQTEDMESESPSSQTPLETDIPLPLPVSVLGEGVKSSHGPSTHPGNSNDPSTPLAVSGVGSPMDCTGYLPNKRPVSGEHFEVWELIALFADRWKRQQSEALPKHDNLQRVLQALRDFDFTSCQAAIYGHHKLATKEGSQLGRYFRHIFPAAKINGKSHTNKLDEDRFREFVEAGKKLIPNKNAELKRKQIKQKMDQEAERETQHIADLVGVRSGDSFQTMVKKFKGAKS